jgi:hypothetical protein
MIVCRILVTVVIAITAIAPSIGQQQIRFRLTMVNTTPLGSTTNGIFLGVDTSATVDYDRRLGEVSIFPAPPPGGFLVYSQPPVPNDVVWLQDADYRPYRRDSHKWVDTFLVGATWNGGTLRVSWQTQQPIGIDSAYIINYGVPFETANFKAKLWSQENITTNNPLWTRFNVIVWFSAPTSSTPETTAATSFVARPLPFGDQVTFVGDGTEVVLYGMDGREVGRALSVDGQCTMPTTHLAAGPYIAELRNGTAIIRRTMVLRR